jgi:hypothetical protein
MAVERMFCRKKKEVVVVAGRGYYYLTDMNLTQLCPYSK